jgi:hypothetical protein
MVGGSFPCQNWHNSHRKTMCWMLQLQICMVLFWEIRVFLQLSWIGLFGTRLAILQLKMVMFRMYYSQNLTQFSLGNNALDAEAVWNKMRIFCTLQTILQELFLSKTNSSLWRKQCVDAPASNLDVFLSTDKCISSFLLNRPDCNKKILSPPWEVRFAGSITFENGLNSTGKQCARCCIF